MDRVEITKLIKSKKVDKKLVMDCHGPLAHTIYNNLMGNKKKTFLTKEEFDRVKKYLNEVGI